MRQNLSITEIIPAAWNKLYKFNS